MSRHVTSTVRVGPVGDDHNAASKAIYITSTRTRKEALQTKLPIDMIPQKTLLLTSNFYCLRTRLYTSRLHIDSSVYACSTHPGPEPLLTITFMYVPVFVLLTYLVE